MQVGLPTLRGSQPFIARPPSTYRRLLANGWRPAELEYIHGREIARLCQCSPIGRGIRLKIVKVVIRIHSLAPYSKRNLKIFQNIAIINYKVKRGK